MEVFHTGTSLARQIRLRLYKIILKIRLTQNPNLERVEAPVSPSDLVLSESHHRIWPRHQSFHGGDKMQLGRILVLQLTLHAIAYTLPRQEREVVALIWETVCLLLLLPRKLYRK